MESTDPANTPAPAAPPKRKGAAKRAGRPSTGRGDRIVLGTEVLQLLDKVAADLSDKLGFRPSHSQVVGYLIAQRQATTAAS